MIGPYWRALQLDQAFKLKFRAIAPSNCNLFESCHHAVISESREQRMRKGFRRPKTPHRINLGSQETKESRHHAQTSAQKWPVLSSCHPLGGLSSVMQNYEKTAIHVCITLQLLHSYYQWKNDVNTRN